MSAAIGGATSVDKVMKDMFQFICGEKKYGTLERMESNSRSQLRTNVIYGYFVIEPMVGMQFFMISAPLSGNEHEERRIATSEIVSIEILDEACVTFKTVNSVYKLTTTPALI